MAQYSNNVFQRVLKVMSQIRQCREIENGEKIGLFWKFDFSIFTQL